jgi:hypothetical protein
MRRPHLFLVAIFGVLQLPTMEIFTLSDRMTVQLVLTSIPIMIAALLLYAMCGKSRAGEPISDGYREACSMSGCDQFVGVATFPSASPNTKYWLCKRGALSVVMAPTPILEIADPAGRSLSFHQGCFQHENGPRRCEINIWLPPPTIVNKWRTRTSLDLLQTAHSFCKAVALYRVCANTSFP